ncbi:MAG: hypothetical protein CM1200mP18_23380 [Gammaproteobacteria bacterium]|nr:MAG: hypothetical protein CM1200mP18_23380 [Gammaproteobacteria bacterium]
MGVPRRYFANEGSNGFPDWIPESAQMVNVGITIAAICVASAQLVFLWNLYHSATRGKPSGGNPWGATTLEWQTPDTPPTHGTLAKSCHRFIVGRMTIVCRVPKKTLFLRTCLQARIPAQTT